MTQITSARSQAILFDWGNTVMSTLRWRRESARCGSTQDHESRAAESIIEPFIDLKTFHPPCEISGRGFYKEEMDAGTAS